MTEPDNSRPPMQYDLSVCAACGKPAVAWQDDYNRNAVGWCGGADCQVTLNGMGSVNVDEVTSSVDVTFAARAGGPATARTPCSTTRTGGTVASTDLTIRMLAALVRSVYGLNDGGAPWEQSDTKKILEDILAGVPSTTSYLQGRALAAWRDEVEREIAAWRADKTTPSIVVPTSPLYAFLTEHDIPPNSGGEGVPWWGDTEPVSASVQEVKEGMRVNGGSVESTGWVVRKLGALDECLAAQRSLNDDRPWPQWLSDWKRATSRSSQDPGGSSDREEGPQ